MSYFVWAEGESEHDGRWVYADGPEDAAGGYAVSAVSLGKGFVEELACDGGSVVFCVRRGVRVYRVLITAHFTRTIVPG
jgi:hypothetical protein